MADIIINPLSGKGDKKVSISSSVNEGIDKSEEYAISTLDIDGKVDLCGKGILENICIFPA